MGLNPKRKETRMPNPMRGFETHTTFEVRRAGRHWEAVAFVWEPRGFVDERAGMAVDGVAIAEERIIKRCRTRREAEQAVAQQRFVVWPGDLRPAEDEED